MIIDCFTFNDEFNLLEGRLEYLNDIVDYFVIVEGDITFSGKSREFQYVKQLSRYQKYADKILFFPFSMDCTGLDFNLNLQNFDLNSAPWKVESAQRNHFSKALKLFNRNDITIIGDVDEIPSKTAIRTAIACLQEEYKSVVTSQQMFYYNFNQIQELPCYCSIITTVGNALDKTPQGIRLERLTTPWLRNGGWHLSSFMTPEKNTRKNKKFLSSRI